MQIYVVQEGDSVDSIAAAFGVSAASVTYNNQIPYPYRLAVGEALLLNGAEPLSASQRSVYVGGYAYPFILPWTLEETLPYLSYLYIFSYGFTTQGDLIAPVLNDAFMLSLAKTYQTAPILTLTPFGEDGRFNNTLISEVIANPIAVERLKNGVIAQMAQRGFEGLDIDFEYILVSDRERFVDFVTYMQQSVSQLGYPTSVALAPKTSGQQIGLLYEGKDYPRLGTAADYVLLMTYEWGYKYGPPLPVAPLNKVREVVEYAVTVIAPEKIHLGIPNYGYDWELPYVSGSTAATTIGNVEAIQIAIQNNARIQFDETAQSPFFTYQKGDRAHIVWFEDVRSLLAKFRLIDTFGLRGMSYWPVMQLFRANWLLLSDFFTIRKD